MLKYFHTKRLEPITVTDAIISAKAAFGAVKVRPGRIFFYKTTDSTNERARSGNVGEDCDFSLCLDGVGAELFIADAQSAGRGRVGRRFVSNSGAGLYMSLRFEFPSDICDSVGITPLAAVAVCRALKRVCGAEASIKWVNDVYMDGKKLAGILTESTVDSLGRRVFICGIGINLCPSNMPSEVSAVATDLLTQGYSPHRFALAAAICEELLENLDGVFRNDIVSEYKSRSFLIGRGVTVIGANGSAEATVVGITDRYELTVRFADGTQKELSTGEVSLKL